MYYPISSSQDAQSGAMAFPHHAHMLTEATEAPEEEEVAGDSKVCLGQVLHLELVFLGGA